MATIKFFVSAKKISLAPIYVRLSVGRGCDLIVKTGLMVEPHNWSNTTETIRQRIKSKSDKLLTDKLARLRDHISTENKLYGGAKTKDWLAGIINAFHNIKDDKVKTLNGFVEAFISGSESGERKNRDAANFAEGTIKTLRGMQRLLNEFQGIYTDERLAELAEQEKTPRPLNILDFDDITVDFHRDFVSFMSDEGYKVNTIGKHVKLIKYIMRKALTEGLHTNRQFLETSFAGFSEDSHAVYLTTEEIEKIYNHDLSHNRRMEIARDAFVSLCETALRVSDYKQINFSIKEIEGNKFISLYQKKTGDQVVIPLTARMEAILEKYSRRLPKIPEQHVNRHIKTIAAQCGIDEEIHWPAQKYGKKYTASAKKYELVTCHTGRRTACTNLYKAGIPVIDIMKISGHRTEKSFMSYIRITPEETALRLAKHPYFKSRLKVV